MVDFVSNRIKEIARISSQKTGGMSQGQMNPADVLSRGCSPRHLLESKWKYCHAKTQMLVSILRKILDFEAKEDSKKYHSNCIKCKRYNAGPVKSESVSLPADRIRDAGVFEVIVYRAVHLELVTALSTNNFLLSLRRSIARRGRRSVVYTDNGTNFRGAVREFKNLDWIKIERKTEIQRIKWKFNPPTAAWWGGWWERLIRVLKDLLKRTLWNAALTYEELLTVLCDCESIFNSRPLTYVSEDSDDLIPLTPAMFMMSNVSLDVTDLDLSDFARFQKRVKFRARLLKDLRGRFRKVIELIPGRDGIVRTLKLRCSNSEIIRPIQRVFSLEIQSAEMGESNDVPLDAEALEIPSAGVGVSESAIPVSAPPNMPKVSRYGRTIQRPRRLNVYNVTTVFESE
ncbi:integrase catalytic domain-containing protein [Trichonephila clavipes]|nr:integrase catalytic domain-containing protein [Trichonephila clavipes]